MSGVEGGGSRAVRRTAGMSLSEGGGVFGREKLFGNSRCHVLYYFAGAVCPGCSHRRPQPGQLIKNRNLSLRFWRLENSKLRVLRDSVSGEGTIPVSSRGEGVREPCGSPL